MNSKNSSFQNVIYLRFTLVFSVYARASGIIAGYIGIQTLQTQFYILKTTFFHEIPHAFRYLKEQQHTDN